MNRITLAALMLVLSATVWAQSQPTGTQSQPAAQPGTGQSATPQQGAAPATQPSGKRPLQAKTQAEYEAYNTAKNSSNDPAAMEKAADDFAAKFPDSELRSSLFQIAMRSYQQANNADKMMEMGRKVLKIDPDEPEALVGVAQVLAERTRDTDLDKDQRFEESIKLAQHALQTVDMDINAPAGTPQEKIDAYKNFLKSNAYYVLGTVQFNKEKYADAESSFRKSIDALPSQPDPLVLLRLALSLDKQDKYPEALKFADQAVQLTQENSQLGTLARNERNRLAQLTGTGSPAPAPKPPSSAQNPSPQKN
jgi:tetratricopeptide (TPR) repeat protein